MLATYDISRGWHVAGGSRTPRGLPAGPPAPAGPAGGHVRPRLLGLQLLLIWPAIDPGLHTVYDRTIAYQAGSDSPFSIWGQVAGLEPLRIAILAAVAAFPCSAFRPRERAFQVAALGAALLIGVQLTMHHWFYLYIVWFYPLLLLALATRGGEDSSTAVQDIRLASAPGGCRWLGSGRSGMAMDSSPPNGSSRSGHMRAAVLLATVAVLALLALPSAAVASPFDFLAMWGSRGSEPGQFESPVGIAVDPRGNAYVADSSNNRIQVFDPCHRWSASLGEAGTATGQLQTPLGVALGAAGNLYVANANNDRVDVLDPAGEYLFGWGGFGSGDGQFKLPVAVATGPGGEVYVADLDNDRIEEFGADGSFVRSWGRFGSGNGQFNLPFGVATDSQGRVYVADTGNNRIQVFDPSGNFIRKWGGFGSGSGQFRSPRGVAVDPVGNAFVADTSNNRIQVFDPSGAFLAAWGSTGSGEGQFSHPQDVAVDGQGDVYVTEDHPNDRVQVFGEPAQSPTVGDLLEAVEATGFPHGIRNSLEAKLRAAQASFDRGAPDVAARQLAAFASELEALAGKKLDPAVAAALVSEARLVTSGSPCAA